MPKPVILTLLSPRYEFSYRMHDALLDHPTLSKQYDIQIVPYSPGDEIMPDVSHYNATGIITSLNAETEDMGKLVATGAHVVNISSSPYPGTSLLYVSLQHTAEMIVRHARSAGFKTLAFLPTIGVVSQENEQGMLFKKLARAADLHYWQESVAERPLGVSLEQWTQQHQAVIDRLITTEERTLVYAFHDWRAETLLEILIKKGVDIPEQVGVLGRGNTLNARSGRLSISSFATPFLSLAHKAVEMIKEGVSGAVHVAHGDVIARASTVSEQDDSATAAVVGTQTRLVTETLPKMIRQYGIEGITVDELAALAGVSRSALEKNYRLVHGEAPSAALKRVRMKRIEHLLKSTDLTISAIAEMVGFSSTRSFFTMFEKQHGMSPGQWRKG